MEKNLDDVRKGLNYLDKKFEEWKTEVKRLLYEQDHPSFNIAQVEESSDYWKDLFADCMSPQEAIDYAIEQARDQDGP